MALALKDRLALQAAGPIKLTRSLDCIRRMVK